MRYSQPQVSFLHIIAILILLNFACQDQSSTQPQADEHKTNEKTPVVVPVNPYAANPYKSSGVDPLAALYGGQVGQSQVMTVKDLKSIFQNLKASPLNKPFPSKWAKVLKGLSKNLSAKVTEWSSLTRTRMENGKRDKVVSFSLSLLGREQAVSLALANLRQLGELKQLPKKFEINKQVLNISAQQTLEYSFTYDEAEDQAKQSLRLAKLEVTWRLERANPKTELKNCRYVHALEASFAEADIPWAAQHFKSTSTRRFVEWFVSQKGTERSWTGTWLYRNGSYRDKAVGWWTTKLESKGAKQKSLNGMEQVWSLPKQMEIDWWPESDPSPMGCEIAGPLLSVRSSQAQ